jgi:NADPH:quinone reductase-like Zn-dependent oxidoreductase
MMTTMKAAVIHEAGAPEVLKIGSLPIPTPKNGEALIRVKAFGLNRSELFTRRSWRLGRNYSCYGRFEPLANQPP